MTPNVSKLLIKWGVDKVIGDNLVEFEELNMRRKDGTKIGYTKIVPNVRQYASHSSSILENDRSNVIQESRCAMVVR